MVLPNMGINFDTNAAMTTKLKNTFGFFFMKISWLIDNFYYFEL